MNKVSHAYERMAEDELDVVFHLATTSTIPGIIATCAKHSEPNVAASTIPHSYSNTGATQALADARPLPLIVTPDDHESKNDCAQPLLRRPN